MQPIRNLVRGLIFRMLLAPLIRRNYLLRAAGAMPDEWYWADELAVNWGMFVCG